MNGTIINTEEDRMNRTILALALILLASPVAALERSPGGPLGRDGGDSQASSGRGDRISGDRDRSMGRDRETSRSYVQRDHSGHAGDHE